MPESLEGVKTRRAGLAVAVFDAARSI